MAHAQFTAIGIRGLRPKAKPYKVTELAAKGAGRLMLKVLPNGSKEFYFRYRVEGSDKLLLIGAYSETGRAGRTLAEVRTRYAELSKLLQTVGDVKEHLTREAEGRAHAEQQRKRRLEVEASRGSLSQLLNAYIQALRDAGKVSAKEVEGIFERYIADPWPDLLERKANEINAEDIQWLLAGLVKRGVTRQVNQLRSYLRAAFAFGGKHDLDPRRLAMDGARFYLTGNPVALVPRIAEYKTLGERHLTELELRRLWRALDSSSLVTRSFVRLMLALGGQRVKQVLRAQWADYDLDKKILLLRDPKGRGPTRDHLVPLTTLAIEQIEIVRAVNGEAAIPFTSDGKRALRLETVSAEIKSISDAMREKHGTEPFRLGDLRRTCETMLAALGIDRETRAHLLSHGRSTGVQAKHYDRYTYLVEKRTAVEKWETKLRAILHGKQARMETATV